MCGIAGYCRFGEPAGAAPDLGAMIAILAHRGPDDAGVFCAPGVGLGVRRLAIIDPEGGRQPISNETGSVHAIQNGEIYNYRELRTELESLGHRFRTASDTETLVHGYEEWQDALVDHLRGMFAVALWDGDRERLLLARDHFGIKPLFYTQAPGWLLFASEIKSLLLDPRIPRELDPLALDQYLSFLYIPAPSTIFKGIHELPPGHLLVAEKGKVEQKRYFKPEVGQAFSGSEAQAIERVRSAFEQSVNAHLVSDVPVGAFLSGGIDSSSIVAMIKRHTDAPVRTFSIGFGERERHWDELDAAARVARYFGTEHTAFRVTPDVVDLLPRVIWHFDQPFANPTAVLMLLLSRETRRHVKVALAGTGGDELFAGYPRYLGMQAFGYYRHLPASARRGIATVADSVMRDRTDGRLAAQRTRRFFDGGALPFDECYIRWLVAIDQVRKNELYSPLMRESLRGADSFGFIRPLLAAENGTGENERLLLADFQTYLPSNQLHYADRMSMAASLEVRVPFVDRRLFDAVKGLTLKQKLSGGKTKGLFRKAMAPFLPPEILNAPKLGLNAPVSMWFRDELKGIVHSLLSPAVLNSRGYFEPEPVARLIAEQEAGIRDHSLVIWALIVFEVWHRLYLDRADIGVPPDAEVLGVHRRTYNAERQPV